MISQKKFLILLFALAFFVRACVFISLVQKDKHAWFYPDSEQYNTAALQFVNGKGNVNPDGSPQLYRLPGYPLFLAACYKVFGLLYGLDPSSKAGMTMVLWVQIILASLIPLLIFFLTVTLFPSQILIAQGAGIFAAVHVGFCLYAGMVATETLSLIALLCFFILFLHCLIENSLVSFETATSWPPQDERGLVCARGEEQPLGCVSNHTSAVLFLAGLILGLASLIRPIGHYVLVISLIMLVLPFSRIKWLNSCARREPVEPFVRTYPSTRLRQGFDGQAASIGGRLLLSFVEASGRARERYLLQVLMLSLGWLIAVAPWLLRNFLITGSLFFHTLPGLHFLQYAAANVIMERDSSSYNVVRPKLLKKWDDAVAAQEKAQDKLLNEYERCVIAEKIAFGYMKQHPWLTIKTSAIQMLKSCCSLYTAQTLLSDSGIWPGYTRDTTLWTKIKRFLFPSVKHTILIPIIYFEILCMMFIMFGMGLFCVSLMFNRAWLSTFLQILPFMLMFIFITLAYGCARLRFPIEPFLIIFSTAGWIWIYDRMRKLKNAF